MLKAARKLGAQAVAKVRSLGRTGRGLLVALCAAAVVVGLLLVTDQPPVPTGAPTPAARIHHGDAGPSANPTPSYSNPSPAGTSSAGTGLDSLDPASMFVSLAGESDIWSTQQQSALRWQAAKMSALGKLISSFPRVRSASVLLEPATARSLGGAGSSATAAVTVAMEDQAPVSGSMAWAIAEMVAGSVAGMEPHDVHVIDGAGRSVPLEQPAVGVVSLDQRRQDETFFAEKIRAALPHMPDLVVAVDTQRQDDQARCASAAVLAPRSCLVAAWDAAGAGGDITPEFAAGQLERVRQVAARASGLDDPSKLWADWYEDKPAVMSAHPHTVSLADWPAWQLGAAGAAALAVGAAGMWLLVRRARRRAMVRQLRRRRRRLRREANLHGAPADLGELLDQMSASQVAALVGDEHPQVIAVALSRCASEHAAAVLAQLDVARQAEVAGRMASAGQLAPELVMQIERALVDRLSDREHPGPQQTRLHAARVLGQMPGGSAVLAELGRTSPELAASLRGPVMTFEQLMDVSPQRLAPALHRLDDAELAVALRAADRALVARILSCLEPARAKTVRKHVGRLGPVRLGDIELAQQHVLEALAGLESGQYVSAAKREVLA